MNTAEEWLEAIAQDPTGLAMLVYADYLEENGKPLSAQVWRDRYAEEGKILPHRERLEYKSTDSDAVWRRWHKMKNAGCSFCPWHGGENQGRRASHGSNKKKSHRDR